MDKLSTYGIHVMAHREGIVGSCSFLRLYRWDKPCIAEVDDMCKRCVSPFVFGFCFSFQTSISW